ncbi:MAG: nuclear transport factor 2 family protein [Oscillospiraceae bacterium]|nr:nuclear transport factor 2 family protein [Oscillospiraceae bacterium]
MDIKQFWKDVLAQDRDAIREYFCDDAYVNWHCTNEHFSVEEFIRANCEYPGEWDGAVERIENAGDTVITATHVYPKDKSLSFHVISFIRIRRDKIISVDEYWADDGEAPQWRKEMRIGQPIK